MGLYEVKGLGIDIFEAAFEGLNDTWYLTEYTDAEAEEDENYWEES